MGQTASNTKQDPFSGLDPTRRKIAIEMAKERVQRLRDDAVPQLEALQREISRRTKLTALRADVPPKLQAMFQPARYKGAHGGRGSAKSWTFGLMLLDKALKQKGLRWACIREVQKSLNQSVKLLLEDLIQLFDLGQQFRVLTTHIETPGNGVLIFQGMQNHTAESIKSLEGFDGAWVEEAQSLSQTSLNLLRPTIRKPDSELWFTWNPKAATDPVDQLLRHSDKPPGAIVVEVNYHDNPNFPAILRTEMEYDLRRDVEKYNHVWLGQYERHSEARVFKNWRVEAFETPSSAEFLYGGDFGFSVDPTVGVRGFVIGRNLFIDAEAYKIGCEIDDTPALFDSVGCTLKHTHTHELIGSPGHKPGTLENHCQGNGRKWIWTCDSARPETISYLQRHNYGRAVGAKKGPGSVEEGVEFLKNYDIIIHPHCTHTIDEYTNYCYKKHPLTDQVMPVLDDKKNHVIDANRYMLEPIRNPQATWVTW